MLTFARITSIVVGLVLALSILWAIFDYRKWRALGPGGLPPNVIGWLKTTAMRFHKSDPLDTERYATQINAPGDHAFLGDLPKREGRRPTIAVHPVPHRQLDQFVDTEMKRKVAELFDATVARQPELLHFKLSYLEKRHQAIFLCHPENGHEHGVNSHGEVAHIHPSDSSMHMIFSPSDAKTVILGGWGERHPLAGGPLPGTELVLPDTYLFIYPPRNDVELGITRILLDASVSHMAMVSPAGERQIQSPAVNAGNQRQSFG